MLTSILKLYSTDNQKNSKKRYAKAYHKFESIINGTPVEFNIEERNNGVCYLYNIDVLLNKKESSPSPTQKSGDNRTKSYWEKSKDILPQKKNKSRKKFSLKSDSRVKKQKNPRRNKSSREKSSRGFYDKT